MMMDAHAKAISETSTEQLSGIQQELSAKVAELELVKIKCNRVQLENTELQMRLLAIRNTSAPPPPVAIHGYEEENQRLKMEIRTLCLAIHREVRKLPVKAELACV
jgi:hypothetical protein